MRILGGQYDIVGSFESVFTQHQLLHNNIEAILYWFFSFSLFFFFWGGGLRVLLS